MTSRPPSFAPAVLDEIRVRRDFLHTGVDRLVIDGDAHISDPALLPPAAAARYHAGPNYYHGRPITAEELIAEMDMSGVDAALVWQNPAATHRGSDAQENFDALRAANRYVHVSARRFPERLIPAGWTDPAGLGLERALELVDCCVREFGFLVVKLNPAQNRYPIDSDVVRTVVDRILGHGAIPAFHVGADTEFTPAAGLARIARHCGSQRLIAVHMGGGGAGYVEGESLAQEIRTLGLIQPNLFFVESAKRDCHIESDLITYEAAGAPFSANIGLGSDAPYGKVAWNFGGYRQLFRTLRDSRHPDPRLRGKADLFAPGTERRYLGGNLCRLLLAGYNDWLGTDPAPAAISVTLPA